MTPYEAIDIKRILAKSCSKLDIPSQDESLVSIASRARGIPRLANRFLKIIRNNTTRIDLNNVEDVFESLGIDKRGLDTWDRRYLETLSKTRLPLGLSTLSGYLGMTEQDIEETIEPYLLANNMIIKTPRGRLLATR
jgi:Holliday junction DNA helicase RuvB